MTQEQFEQNFYFDQTDGENTVRLNVWDNSIGEVILSLEIPNPPERFKDYEFFNTEEWEEKIKPEVIKLFYQFHSLLFVKRL
jgi:hypothetical protein